MRVLRSYIERPAVTAPSHTEGSRTVRIVGARQQVSVQLLMGCGPAFMFLPMYEVRLPGHRGLYPPCFR
jgi:hypothetical protein